MSQGAVYCAMNAHTENNLTVLAAPISKFRHGEGVSMAILKNYNEFVERVNELGFMALSDILPGFPSVSAETLKEAWHTGDADTDPWCWKDRAAEEKQLAFGCILGGNKGFVSAGMYPYFYAFYQPKESMEDRWLHGLISPEVNALWKLFQTKTLLNTSDIRYEMAVGKKGGGKVDNAIVELQKQYYITVAGNRRKLNKSGQPYGWPANVYDRVENWVPAPWLAECCDLDKDEAGQYIVETGLSISDNVKEAGLRKVLSIR